MRTTRIYLDTPLSANTEIRLDGNAHHHLAVVLRARLHDTVVLFNGDGIEYTGPITAISKKKSTININETTINVNESPLKVHLGQCISSNSRFDLAVQKSTEMGVNIISPIISDHSQTLNSQQTQKRIAHWQHIAVSAAEQSHRACPPIITMPITLQQWLNDRNEDEKWVAAIGGTGPSMGNTSVSSLALLVGPEGGLSEDEVLAAKQSGFCIITMGNRILRTETAPIAALSLAQFFWGDHQN